MIKQGAKGLRPHDQITLLSDHSINWRGFDRDALLAEASREGGLKF